MCLFYIFLALFVFVIIESDILIRPFECEKITIPNQRNAGLGFCFYASEKWNTTKKKVVEMNSNSFTTALFPTRVEATHRHNLGKLYRDQFSSEPRDGLFNFFFLKINRIQAHAESRPLILSPFRFNDGMACFISSPVTLFFFSFSFMFRCRCIPLLCCSFILFFFCLFIIKNNNKWRKERKEKQNEMSSLSAAGLYA